MTIQPQNNNLSCLIDQKFTNVNRLFVLPLKKLLEKIIQQKIIEILFLHYYVPNVEIKDFNVLIAGKSSFDLPVKNEEEVYEKIVEISTNNDYTTGNFLGFVCLKKLQTNSNRFE